MTSAVRSDALLGLPRWAYKVALAVVALDVALVVLDAALGGASGPPSSAHATSPSGLAAYAALLEHYGHPVVAADRVDVDPSYTAVVADPRSLDRDGADALRQFVEDGGRLVAGGPSAVGWLERIVDHAPEWGRVPAGRVATDPRAAATRGTASVEAGGGRWVDAGSGRVVAGRPSSALLTVERVGDGTVLALADVSVLHNDRLARADNAAFGLVLAGEDGRTVAFVEAVHGYGDDRGWSALPARWRWTLGGLAVAAAAFAWARGRRLGPPEEPERPLPPPRRAYVDALAGTLARTKRRDTP